MTSRASPGPGATPDPGSRRPVTYPRDVTTLVGRDAELRTIRELLTRVRLLSLIGVGGVGKTRLAKEVVAGTRRSFRDGVCFVDLTAVQDPALVEQVIRDSTPGAPAATSLVGQVGDLALLLVLDNCEHVYDALGPLVSELLAWCPRIRVLTTSRRPLSVGGEYILNVLPLGTGSGAGRSTDSGTLFQDRAAAAGGTLSADDLAAVNELCVRLEGLPLAIELAATKTRTMTVGEIIAGLDDRFSLLRGGPRDSPARHRSLDAVLRWSWDRCTPEEQRLWGRLALFAGPASMNAIVEVCGFATLADAVDSVDNLVQQTVLVRGETAGEASFGMLETIREYGRLRPAAEAGGGSMEDDFRDRHLRYFRRLAANAREGWFGPEQRRTAQRLVAGMGDFRLAFDHALGTGRLADAGSLFEDLWLYWVGCGHLYESRTWARRLWDGLAEHRRAPSCRSLWTRGWISVVTGDIDGARQDLRECRDRAPAEGTPRDDYTARSLLAGCAAIGGNYQGAVEQYERAIESARAADDPLGLALMLQNYAEISMICGDLDRAEQTCESSEQVCLAHGDEWCFSHVVWVRSLISYMRGDLPDARRQGLRALELKISVEDQLGMALALEVVAWTAAAAGDHLAAAVLLGGTEAYWGSAGSPLMGLPHLVELRGSCLRALAEALGPERLRAGLDEGARIGLERLPTLATASPVGALATAARRAGSDASDGRPPAPIARTPTPPEVSELAALTAREREVAYLVAEGMTNKAIAARLVIGQRTVDTHVARVLTKLGALRRSEVAAIVARSER